MPIEIVSAEFGLFENGDRPGETVFTPATIVPHRTGQRYGWSIELRSAQRSLSVREEYLLSQAAAKSATAADPESGRLTIELPRHAQVSQRQLVPVENTIYGEWAVGPTEPAGHRRLAVIIEGKPAAIFEFDVK